MKIPFSDLKIQYESLKPEIDEAMHSVIEQTAFVRGPFVSQFEKQYAASYGVKHCISVGNGTDALYISLKALGIGPGDEVITTACSWIATSEVITQTGARVVFVDIDPDYYTIDAARIEEKITARTKAIVPVHLYGQPADMDAIVTLCRKHDLYLVEDCAQAHFAQYKGQKVGSFGQFGTFSFYPGKNLGAYGDAGAIITDDDELADRARMFANHGSRVKHEHEIEGINSRMDGIQAAVLSVKLAHLSRWNERRYENALIYDDLLKDVDGIVTPRRRPDATHIFHLYVVRTQARDHVQQYLKDKGISTGIHYPKPLPFLKAYEYLDAEPGGYPVAYEYQDQILSLPMFPELKPEQIRYVVQAIQRSLSVENARPELSVI